MGLVPYATAARMANVYPSSIRSSSGFLGADWPLARLFPSLPEGTLPFVPSPSGRGLGRAGVRGLRSNITAGPSSTSPMANSIGTVTTSSSRTTAIRMLYGVTTPWMGPERAAPIASTDR